MWNLRNKTSDTKEKRDKRRNRLLPIENKLRVSRREVGGWMGDTGNGD